MDAVDYSRGRRPPPTGFRPFPGGGGVAAAVHMNPVGFELHAHDPLPQGVGPFYGGAGAMHAATEHTNPFSFGLDLACPPPYWYGFGPFYGGGTEQMYPVTLELLGRHLTTGYYSPFIGGGGVTVNSVHAHPFSFGLDLAPPPLTGFGPFYGAACMGTEQWSPFTVGVLDDVPVPFLDGFLSNPVYGNAFADGATRCMHLPASWDMYDDGHAFPRFEVPAPLPAPAAPASDGANVNSSKTLKAEPDNYDIDAILLAKEQRAEEQPSPDYLETTQKGRMTPKTRASLVRWMGRITRLYELAPGTLHRAVSYADRFLSLRALPDVGRRHLHLLGAAAIYAAAKYEDQVTLLKLNAKEIALYCWKSATSQEVLDMERALLGALDYRLGGPTARTFVEHFTQHYSQENEEDLKVRRTAHRLADMSLRDYDCLKLRPSAVAAAAIFLARLTLNPSYGQVKKWNRELKTLTGYKPKDLEYGVESMCSLMRKVEHDRGGFDVVIFPMFYADPS